MEFTLKAESFATKFQIIHSLGVIQKLRYAFFSIFDHLPTYGNVLAIILLIIYLIKICNSYILLTTHLQWAPHEI